MTARSTQDGRIIPKTALFTVRGIVSSGYRELDALWFFISYDDGLRFLPPESSRAFLGVKIADPYKDMDAVATTIERSLPKGYFLTGWYDLQRSQYRSYQSTRQLLVFIMAIIVIVAAVNVSSATSMLAVERRRDIAILKSFGADPGGSTRVFLFGALLTGLTGSILGLTAGVLVAVNINGLIHFLESALTLVSNFGILLGGRTAVPAPAKLLDPAYYLQVIPITIDWGALVIIGAGTTLCSVLTAWAPARRAGKMMPLEILRKY
jgi:lipoprotein-releasing system permease protein